MEFTGRYDSTQGDGGWAILTIGLIALTGMTTAAGHDKFKVVTTFTVIADMAQNVAGDKAEVTSITKPGAEIHEYQPTPQDIVRAHGADLILRNGFDLERWFDKFLQKVGDVPSIDPDNTAAYRRNAEKYKDQIRRTIAPMQKRIDNIPLDQRTLVSCEGAFSCLV